MFQFILAVPNKQLFVQTEWPFNDDISLYKHSALE